MRDNYFYQTIVEQTTIGYSYNKIIYNDAGKPVDYQFIEMNQAYESMINIQKNEWIGERISKLYKKMNTEPVSWEVFHDSIFTKHKNNDTEMNFKHLGKCFRIKIHSPKKDYIIISLTDISIEVSKTENLQILFDSVPIQVWYLKNAETYLSANKAHAKFLGFDRDQLVKMNIRDMVNSESAKICITGNEKVFKEKREIVSEEWLPNPQGENRLLRITKKPELTAQGEIEFVICSAEDITYEYTSKQRNEMQERILCSSIHFTEELLSNKNIEEALRNGIRMLGKATKVDRVYYWENHYNEKSKQWLTSQKIEWCLDKMEQVSDKSPLQDIAFEEISEFIEPLSNNETFCCSTKELDEKSTTKKFLESQGILSVLTIPIFLKNQFIGFIEFDSYAFDREWSQVEISLLNSFVFLYAKALERDRLEQKVKQTNDNFFNFFNMIEDLLIVLDYEGTIIDINNNVLKQLSYTRKELLGAPFLKLHPEDEVEKTKKNFNELITKGTEYFRLNLLTKEGDIFPIEARNSKGIWNGKPVIFAVGKDISELTLSEDKFSKAFNNSGISMFISRFKDGKLLEVNDKFLDFFGYIKSEVIGKTTLELQMTKDYDERDTFKEMIQRDKKITDLEINYIDKNKKIHTGLTNIVPITINNEDCLLTSIIDISDRVANEKEIVELSTRDYLTSTYNRRFIYEVLDEIIEDSKREKIFFSVAIIDIDNFKSINDYYGHQVGDDVLVEFTRILKDNLRSHDILGRYGGEEFIVIINHADIEESNHVLKRVLGSVRDHVFQTDEEQIELTFSAGIASCKEFTDEKLTIDKLIEKSDRRMYRAKKSGKNQIVFRD